MTDGLHCILHHRPLPWGGVAAVFAMVLVPTVLRMAGLVVEMNRPLAAAEQSTRQELGG